MNNFEKIFLNMLNELKELNINSVQLKILNKLSRDVMQQNKLIYEQNRILKCLYSHQKIISNAFEQIDINNKKTSTKSSIQKYKTLVSKLNNNFMKSSEQIENAK